MRKSFLLGAALVVLAACRAPAQTTKEPAQAAPAQAAEAVTRRVEGQTLVSQGRPAVRLTFDQGFKYAGGQSFILYGVALAEQHFFVDADRDGRIRRLYWVQFEGYLPSNNYTYDYSDVKETTNLGGLDFVTDAVVVPFAAVGQQRADSDGARARAFLESKGYRLAGNDLMWRRLVHFPEASKRSELMIIYLEDLGGTGLTAADLSGQGREAARWPEVSSQLLKRAAAGVKITHD